MWACRTGIRRGIAGGSTNDPGKGRMAKWPGPYPPSQASPVDLPSDLLTMPLHTSTRPRACSLPLAGLELMNCVSLLLPPCNTRPAPPPQVSYDAILDGLASPRRSFELPGRMALPDMVEVLNDIWEVES